MGEEGPESGRGFCLLIKHGCKCNVKAISLTGSTSAGKSVAKKAGSVLKKTVLELGGSDAYLVLKDADLDLAIDACSSGRLLNSGQSCISAKRFIIDQTIKSEFERVSSEASY